MATEFVEHSGLSDEIKSKFLTGTYLSSKQNVLGCCVILWERRRLWKQAGIDVNPSFVPCYVIGFGQLSELLRFLPYMVEVRT